MEKENNDGKRKNKCAHEKLGTTRRREKLSLLRMEYELKAARKETGSGQIFYVIPFVAMFASTLKYEFRIEL